MEEVSENSAKVEVEIAPAVNPTRRDMAKEALRNSSLSKFLPRAITIAGFCFGLTAVRFAFLHKWDMAVLCIFAAAIFDALDGRAARMLGQASLFGAELDSLSDLVCFGIAPALVLFLRSAFVFGNVGWGICLFFAMCCALRLARFNSSQLGESKYFTGVPAPAGAMIALLPIIMSLEMDSIIFVRPWVVSLFLLASGLLMVSKIKTLSTKKVNCSDQPVILVLTGISALIICLITQIWFTLASLIWIYICLIPYNAYLYKKEEEKSAEAAGAATSESNPTAAQA